MSEILITPSLLRDAVGCTSQRAEAFADALQKGCALAEINTPARLAMFLANTGHESASLAMLEESLDYAVDRLVPVFGAHRISAAEAEQFGRKPGQPAQQVEIANLVYGRAWGAKNLGNTQPGDGWRYRARGPIGTTGRGNYRELKPALTLLGYTDVPDFEAEPEALIAPRWGAAAACHYWNSRGLNRYADVGDFGAVCKGINLGTPTAAGTANGMPDRMQRLTRAQAAIANAQPFAAPSPAPIQTPMPAGEADVPEVMPAPPAQEKTMATADTIRTVAGTALTALNPIAGALFSAFAPLAQEKIEKELNRHTDHPEVAQQVSAAIIDAAKTVTGQADPIQAVAAAQRDPELVQQVQDTTVEALNKLLPMLERLHAMDREDRADDEASMNAAAARAHAEGEDMAPKLVDRAFVVYMTVFVSTLLMIGLQMIFATDHKPAGELVGFFIAVATLGARQWEKLFDYRFGSSRGSSTKEAVIARVTQQQRR